jgi:hypothetical protein
VTYPYAAAPPPKYRPRARWWAIGLVLLVLAVASLAGGLYWALSPLAHEDDVFRAADGPVTVDLPAGEERALFVEDGYPVSCTATDADGADVELRDVTGEFTTNEWSAELRFDTGAGDVEFVCDTVAPGAEVRIGKVPTTGQFVGGLALGIGGPILFGFGGMIVLVVTGILWATRSPRPR